MIRQCGLLGRRDFKPLLIEMWLQIIQPQPLSIYPVPHCPRLRKCNPHFGTLMTLPKVKLFIKFVLRLFLIVNMRAMLEFLFHYFSSNCSRYILCVNHCRVGVYMLTEPYGLDYITHCEEEGFHTHPKEPPLYEVMMNIYKWIWHESMHTCNKEYS